MIDLTKKYKIRSGNEVIAIFDNTKEEIVSRSLLVIYKSPEGFLEPIFYCTNGKRYYLDSTSEEYDLIEIKPYDHIKIDDKVYVSDNPITPSNPKVFKRYFAKFKHMIIGMIILYSQRTNK